MADEIDTRVSASISSDILALIEDYDDETRPVLGQTETALSEAHKALCAIHDCKEAAATNPTLNEYAQLVEVDNYATKRMDRVMSIWDRTIDTLNNNIASARAELKQPIEFKAGFQMATEIRAHFKSLPSDGDRMGALRRAIDNNDEFTASAVLGARSYLSGFDEEIHDTFVEEWQAKQMPLQAKRLRAMRAAADLLNDRVKLLKSEWQEAVGSIKIWKEPARKGDLPLLIREISPAEVREMVRKAKKPFAVPVG